MGYGETVADRLQFVRDALTHCIKTYQRVNMWLIDHGKLELQHTPSAYCCSALVRTVWDADIAATWTALLKRYYPARYAAATPQWGMLDSLPTALAPNEPTVKPLGSRPVGYRFPAHPDGRGSRRARPTGHIAVSRSAAGGAFEEQCRGAPPRACRPPDGPRDQPRDRPHHAGRGGGQDFRPDWQELSRQGAQGGGREACRRRRLRCCSCRRRRCRCSCRCRRCTLPLLLPPLGPCGRFLLPFRLPRSLAFPAPSSHQRNVDGCQAQERGRFCRAAQSAQANQGSGGRRAGEGQVPSPVRPPPGVQRRFLGLLGPFSEGDSGDSDEDLFRSPSDPRLAPRPLPATASPPRPPSVCSTSAEPVEPELDDPPAEFAGCLLFHVQRPFSSCLLAATSLPVSPYVSCLQPSSSFAPSPPSHAVVPTFCGPLQWGTRSSRAVGDRDNLECVTRVGGKAQARQGDEARDFCSHDFDLCAVCASGLGPRVRGGGASAAAAVASATAARSLPPPAASSSASSSSSAADAEARAIYPVLPPGRPSAFRQLLPASLVVIPRAYCAPFFMDRQGRECLTDAEWLSIKEAVDRGRKPDALKTQTEYLITLDSLVSFYLPSAQKVVHAVRCSWFTEKNPDTPMPGRGYIADDNLFWHAGLPPRAPRPAAVAAPPGVALQERVLLRVRHRPARLLELQRPRLPPLPLPARLQPSQAARRVHPGGEADRDWRGSPRSRAQLRALPAPAHRPPRHRA